MTEAPSQTVFLTGCGRSGTTILGKVLARHPDIAVLNDRFDLWVRPFPAADAWGLTARAGPVPRIALDGADAREASEAARTAFLASLEHARAGRRVLVEKLALNNFRLPFLDALCPGARFINIVRHGVEVARSIAERAAAGQWYGRGDIKWEALADHAREAGLGDLLDLCDSPYARGLLEWRMSVEAAERFRAGRPDVPWLALRYEHLLADPASVCRSLVAFLGLPRSPAMERFAAGHIRRRSPAAEQTEALPCTRRIAGGALERLGYAIAAEAAA